MGPLPHLHHLQVALWTFSLNLQSPGSVHLKHLTLEGGPRRKPHKRHALNLWRLICAQRPAESPQTRRVGNHKTPKLAHPSWESKRRSQLRRPPVSQRVFRAHQRKKPLPLRSCCRVMKILISRHLRVSSKSYPKRLLPDQRRESVHVRVLQLHSTRILKRLAASPVKTQATKISKGG